MIGEDIQPDGIDTDGGVIYRDNISGERWNSGGPCEHERIEWASSEPGVAITLNGDVAGRCLDCGAEGRVRDA